MPQDQDDAPVPSRALKKYIWRKNRNGKSLLVPREMDGFLVWNLPDDFLHLSQDPQVKADIAILVAEGKTFTDIAAMEGMPDRFLIFAMMQKDEEFREMVEFARKIRGDLYHDKMHALAETVDENESRSAKIKSDIWKHLMAMNDRERFGNQTKIVGDPNRPLSIVFDTGIQRDRNPEPIDVSRSKEPREIPQQDLQNPNLLDLDRNQDQPGEREASDLRDLPNAGQVDGAGS